MARNLTPESPILQGNGEAGGLLRSGTSIIGRNIARTADCAGCKSTDVLGD